MTSLSVLSKLLAATTLDATEVSQFLKTSKKWKRLLEFEVLPDDIIISSARKLKSHYNQRLSHLGGIKSISQDH